MNQVLLQELLDTLKMLAEDRSIRAVKITGKGKGFCAGADLGNLNTEKTQERMLAQGRKTVAMMDSYFNPIVSLIAHMQKPVVAAVNGVAAGGGMGLALAADIVIAAESASFKQVFIPQLGILPDLGSTWTLPRLIGKARTLGLTLLGDSLPAQTAKEWGLIWDVCRDDALAAETDAICQRLAKSSPAAIAALKQALHQSDKNTLDDQLALETDIQGKRCSSEDFFEGSNAFIEKRPPVFN